MARDAILASVTDSTGQAIPGALVRVTNRLDDSNAVVYADETSATTITNPLTTDPDGRVIGWLPGGRYNLNISGAGIAAYVQAYNVYTPDGLTIAGNAEFGNIGPGSEAGLQLSDGSDLNPVSMYRSATSTSTVGVVSLLPSLTGSASSAYWSLNQGRARFGYEGTTQAVTITDNGNNENVNFNLSVGGVGSVVATLTNTGQLQLFNSGSAAGIRLGGDPLANLYLSSVGTVGTDGNHSIGGQGAGPALSVSGSQPASSSGAGAVANSAVSVNGAQGGNTTGTTGQTGGIGASISLTAGQGGNAPVGSTNGTGGSITISPGSAGSGLGTAGSGGALNLGSSTSKIGFYGVTAVARQTGYTLTNTTTNRTLNAQSYTPDQLAQFVETLAADLKSTGIIG